MAKNEYGGLEHGVQQFVHVKHAGIGHGDKSRKERFAVDQMQQARRHGIKSPPASDLNIPPLSQHHRTQNQRPLRTRNQLNWSNGGPGMQAIFLGSNKKPSGTGVFLPRTEPTDFQSSNKPAFSPVLLPARVVQTLNLNVHEIGQQNYKSQPDQPKKVVKKNEEKFEKKKKLDDRVYRSPEIFLPKEWTY